MPDDVTPDENVIEDSGESISDDSTQQTQTQQIQQTQTQQEPVTPQIPQWRQNLSSELREHGDLVNFGSVQDLASDYIKIKSGLPSIPTKREEYQVPKNTPEYVRQFALETGLTQEQLSKTLAFQKAVEKSQSDALRTAQDKNLKDLREEWGDAFDHHIIRAENVIKHFDSEGKLLNLLRQTNANREVIVLKFLKGIADMMQEDGHLVSDIVPSKKSYTKSAAETLYPNQNKL